MNLIGKKIAIVDWSDYPFGGITTFLSDFKEKSKTLGVETDLYIFKKGKSKKNFEEKAYEQTKVNYYQFAKIEIEELFEKFEAYDFVCFAQTPPYALFDKEERMMILEKFKNLKPISGIQMHNIEVEGNFNYNTNLLEYYGITDVIISKEDDRLPATNIAKKLNKTYIPLTLYSDLDKYIDENIEQEEKILYRGRFENYKRPHYLGRLSYYLKDRNPNLKYKMMGIESSIGALNIIHKEPWAKTYRFPDKTGGWVEVEDKFVKEDGIKEMQKCLFGFAPKTKVSSSFLEYAQLEVLQCGGILILHKYEGENSYLPDGRRWIDVPYFAIWLDEDNLQNTADKIEEVLKSKELQKLYKETPKKLLQPLMDESMLEEHLKEIFKATRKHYSVRDILDKFGWEEHEKDMFIEANEKYLIAPYVRFLEEKYIYIFTKNARKPQSLYMVLEGLIKKEPLL